MSLKESINSAFKSYTLVMSHLDGTETNCQSVLSEVKKLKESLEEFANRLDKDFVILTDTLEGKVIDETYTNIEENFVQKIADIAKTDNFIIMCKENGLSPNDKKSLFDKFKYPFKDLMKKFKNSKNLITFFREQGSAFYNYNHDFVNSLPKNIPDEVKTGNGQLYTFFLFPIFTALSGTLSRKEKLIINDEDYFYNADKIDYNAIAKALKEQGKEFICLLPDFHKTVLSSLQEELDKHLVSSVADGLKVFPKGHPYPSEVKQCGIGDCYLMSSLIALSKNNKQYIEQCFTQGLDKVEKENKIDIRFFRKTGNSSSPITITVDKTKVIMPQGIKDGALWPKLIEKAWAIYRIKTGQSSKLDGGCETDVMYGITGKKPKGYRRKENEADIFSRWGELFPIDPDDIIKEIENEFSKSTNKSSLACGFRTEFTTVDVKSKEHIEIRTNHSYAIVGIDTTRKYIRLIEPNKVRGRIIKVRTHSVGPMKEGGHIAMGFEDFKKNFSSVLFS